MSDEKQSGSIGVRGTLVVESVDQSPQKEKTVHEIRGIKVSMSNELAIRFGVVGAGQGGSRIAEVFGGLGYPTCVINTAKQDLKFIGLPEDRKLCMEYGMGGAGKDIALGEEAFMHYRDSVRAMISRTFHDGQDVDYILACVGGGGGTGSGSAVQLAHTLAEMGLPVGMIFTLPQSSEDAIAKSNAIKTLDKLAKLVRDKVLTTLIVVDNAKIETIYHGLSAVAFWQKANWDIANIIHQFNRLTAQPSKFTSLDPMDFAKLLTEGNCTIYGSARLTEYAGPQQLANSLISSVKGGLLADEFKLDETTVGGVIFAGSFDVLSQIPQQDIDYAVYELSNLTGNPGIYKGIYDLDQGDIGRGLVTYTILTGLGVPHKRLEHLAEESERGFAAIESKRSDGNKMSVIDSDSSTTDKDRFRALKNQQSALGRMLGKRKP